MNRAIIMKDRRLIEALDYIDDEYIASAALYKMRSYAESTRPLAQTPRPWAFSWDCHCWASSPWRW